MGYYRILKLLLPQGNVYMTAGVAALELDPDQIEEPAREQVQRTLNEIRQQGSRP